MLLHLLLLLLCLLHLCLGLLLHHHEHSQLATSFDSSITISVKRCSKNVRVFWTDPQSLLEKFLVLAEAHLLTKVLFELCLEKTEDPVCGRWVSVAVVLLSGQFEVVGVVKLGALPARVVELSGTTVVTVGMLVLLSTVVAVLSRRVVVVVSGTGTSSVLDVFSLLSQQSRLQPTHLVVAKHFD